MADGEKHALPEFILSAGPWSRDERIVILDKCGRPHLRGIIVSPERH
jgi:hypothetical protein